MNRWEHLRLWKEETTWRRHEVLGRIASIGRANDRDLVREVLRLVIELGEALPAHARVEREGSAPADARTWRTSSTGSST